MTSCIQLDTLFPQDGVSALLLPDFWAKFLDFRSTLQITLGHVENNNDVQLPFISQPGEKEAVSCRGGTNCTVKVYSSSQSHYLQNGHTQTPSQLSLGFPGMSLGGSPYKTCGRGKSMGFVVGRPSGQSGLSHSAERT